MSYDVGNPAFDCCRELELLRRKLDSLKKPSDHPWICLNAVHGDSEPCGVCVVCRLETYGNRLETYGRLGLEMSDVLSKLKVLREQVERAL